MKPGEYQSKRQPMNFVPKQDVVFFWGFWKSKSSILFKNDMMFVYICCDGKLYTAWRWLYVHHYICYRVCFDDIMEMPVSVEQLVNVPLCLSCNFSCSSDEYVVVQNQNIF